MMSIWQKCFRWMAEGTILRILAANVPLLLLCSDATTVVTCSYTAETALFAIICGAPLIASRFVFIHSECLSRELIYFRSGWGHFSWLHHSRSSVWGSSWGTRLAKAVSCLASHSTTTSYSSIQMESTRWRSTFVPVRHPRLIQNNSCAWDGSPWQLWIQGRQQPSGYCTITISCLLSPRHPHMNSITHSSVYLTMLV